MKSDKTENIKLFTLLALTPLLTGGFGIEWDVLWFAIYPGLYILFGIGITIIICIVKVILKRYKPEKAKFDSLEIGIWVNSVGIYLMLIPETFEFFLDDSVIDMKFYSYHALIAQMFFAPVLCFSVPLIYSFSKRKEIVKTAISGFVICVLILLSNYNYSLWKEMRNERASIRDDDKEKIKSIMYNTSHGVVLLDGFSVLEKMADGSDINVIEHFRDDQRINHPEIQEGYMRFKNKVEWAISTDYKYVKPPPPVTAKDLEDDLNGGLADTFIVYEKLYFEHNRQEWNIGDLLRKHYLEKYNTTLSDSEKTHIVSRFIKVNGTVESTDFLMGIAQNISEPVATRRTAMKGLIKNQLNPHGWIKVPGRKNAYLKFIEKIAAIMTDKNDPINKSLYKTYAYHLDDILERLSANSVYMRHHNGWWPDKQEVQDIVNQLTIIKKAIETR